MKIKLWFPKKNIKCAHPNQAWAWQQRWDILLAGCAPFLRKDYDDGKKTFFKQFAGAGILTPY